MDKNNVTGNSVNTEPAITCRRCGNCCHVDMIAYAVESDIERWRRENRFDILSRIQGNEIVWSGDTIVSARGRHLASCVYLNRDGESFSCDIYETRPRVCRDFAPGSSQLCPLYSAAAAKK